VKFNAESNDVSESAFGKLAKCKSREVKATLVQAGEGEAQQDIVERPEAGATHKRVRPPRAKVERRAAP